MKTVVLAAGQGHRMKPLTSSRPKAMLPVAGEPILAHLLRRMVEAGLSDFIFIVGYQARCVQDYFGNGSKWKASIDYCHQPEPLGTADAVERVRGMVAGPFMVINGDSLFLPEEIRRFALATDCKLGLVDVENAAGLGTVKVKGSRITGIYEKVDPPPSNIASAGVYMLDEAIFPAIESTPRSPRGEYELPFALEHLVANGFDVGFEKLTWWLTFSYPWDLLSGQESILGSLSASNSGSIEPNVTINGAVRIGEGTVVKSGSYLEGPLVIGQNCRIGPNCYIRPFTSIGDGCHIGAGVEVKNSILMSGTSVPHLSYIGDSIIGQGCNFGAGTQIANLRFDGKNIVSGGVDTLRRKMGAVIGDNVSTGINSSINAGTVIGENSKIWPGVVAGGSYEPFSRIRK